VPDHRDRSRVQEGRVAGLAILLATAALILVVVYVVGGLANRTVIQIVDAATPAAQLP